MEKMNKDTIESGIVKPKKDEKDLPFCTKAPSAEHFRADVEDEPCDDGRASDSE